jgi:3',5'-nucleoside bisphosphate phosphatase
MRWYRADLHIHSVLSPCGDLDMSPVRIIHEAKNHNLDIIGITDHNHTGHAKLTIELGEKEGIQVFSGVEINTREEIHCLAFFENIGKTEKFQDYINSCATRIENKPEKFGHQLLVNEKEEILEQIEWLLISSLTCSIDEVEKKVHQLDGVFVPAHIQRKSNCIYTQLGFLPDNLIIDAIEITDCTRLSDLYSTRPELKDYSIILNSDAHYPQQIGSQYSNYYLKEPSFVEWKMALQGINNRKVSLK